MFPILNIKPEYIKSKDFIIQKATEISTFKSDFASKIIETVVLHYKYIVNDNDLNSLINFYLNYYLKCSADFLKSLCGIEDYLIKTISNYNTHPVWPINCFVCPSKIIIARGIQIRCHSRVKLNDYIDCTYFIDSAYIFSSLLGADKYRQSLDNPELYQVIRVADV